MSKRIYIGTSGWAYKGWAKDFYPTDRPKTRQFEFYTTQFSTVEINLTFYRLPTENMVRGWRDKAPTGFVYAVKGSRFITHMKKLTKLNGALDRFFEHIEPLQKRIGVILWQLPPFLRKDVNRLGSFRRQLSRRYLYAVEFRHPSWLDDEVFALLRRHGVAQVSVSSMAMSMNLTVTCELVYIRFHGLAGGAAHDYTREELAPWAAHICKQLRQGKTVFAYFNNDWYTREPMNARLLRDMVGN